ncbi:MAG TPA: BamA/TamA family outer membrane protein [Vicinamibacterales bacterium]|jgi:outer membrane protein assembly factor BamA|nr:BamA/TamA family outer membrane protein [Vicinamibacterales bacterium]
MIGLALALALGTLQPAADGPKVAAIRIHGNHTTPDADVTSLIGVATGDPAPPGLEEAVRARLEKSRRFSDVDVKRRYASLDTNGDILLVIVVTERPGIVEDPTLPGGVRQMNRLTRGGMFLPVLDYEDGYGFTYGALMTLTDVAGDKSRLAFPATWGGTRQVTAKFDKQFARGPFTRVEAVGSYSRRENPFYEVGDVRGSLKGRGERIIAGPLRAGIAGGWSDVEFDPLHEQLSTVGADLTFDTRHDPGLPRGAVFLRGAYERAWFETGQPVNRFRGDARGFVPLIKQSVLALRVYSETADATLPPYEQSLLGGATDQRGTLRGFPAGFAATDNLFATSAEIRIPISSPLSVGRLGVNAFFDAGAAYDRGQKLKDAKFYRGVGAGVWFSVAIVKLNLDIAHGLGEGTRAHLSTGFTF